ncbi:MAG: FAD-dependent oxidoreductase [Gammaproteobacteria bacterium]|nr:FAD-dependent oxidoreductase [Gammaproteobacteria bacterium]
MQRRQFLKHSAALLAAIPVSSALSSENTAATLGTGSAQFSPIIASADRIIEMNVCTRPFRAQGPRIETERMRRKTVVHNYGHGGSGWSLSWGSGLLAVEMAKTTGQQQIAIVGCGAIGLTTALVAQQAGLKVSIYAKERFPFVRSYFATGAWTPASRICSSEHASDFAERWESMARYSHRRFQSLLGVAGDPVEWRDMYNLSNASITSNEMRGGRGEPRYPDFEKELIKDITPQAVELSNQPHPFPVRYVTRAPSLIFNIAAYSRLLMDEFLAAGGIIENFELKDRSDFSALDERTIINCTGYGARELLADDTIVPVRGQTAKLIPQPEVHYGFHYAERGISVYPRRDGLLVQAGAGGDFDNARENLNPEESIRAVERVAAVVEGMRSKV